MAPHSKSALAKKLNAAKVRVKHKKVKKTDSMKYKIQKIKLKKLKLLKKRQARQHKKLASKEHMNELRNKIQSDDVNARGQIEKKIADLEEVGSKNARKQLLKYKKMLSVKCNVTTTKS